MSNPRSAAPGFAIAIAVLIAGLLLALTVGRYPVSLGDLFSVLLAKVGGYRADVSPAVESVILQVRGPRVMAAMLIGAALAIAGTAFQGLFRNPLVSPDILGASSGAALGAVIGIYLSLSVFAIQAVAFLGGLIAVGIVYAIGASVRSRDPILVLVLTGVVVGSLFGAGVGLVKYLADPYNQLPAMTFWLLGSLSATGVHDLLPLFGPVALGAAVLVALRWRMNVMSLAEEEARALGVATGPLRIAIVAAATLVTSASVDGSSPRKTSGAGYACPRRGSRLRTSCRHRRGACLLFPTDLASFLDLIRQHGDAAYSFMFAYAASHSLLLALFAGYAAHSGALGFGTVVIVCWFGSFAGDVIRFWIGRRFGARWLGSMPRLERAVRTAARLADRHYVWMILLHRYPHGIRGVAGFAYGMSQLPWSTFLALNFVAAGLWSCAIVSAGYTFGQVSEKVMSDASSSLGFVLLVAFLGLSWILSKKLERVVERS